MKTILMENEEFRFNLENLTGKNSFANCNEKDLIMIREQIAFKRKELDEEIKTLSQSLNRM